MLKSIALIAVGGLAARFVFAFFPAGLSRSVSRARFPSQSGALETWCLVKRAPSLHRELQHLHRGNC